MEYPAFVKADAHDTLSQRKPCTVDRFTIRILWSELART